MPTQIVAFGYTTGQTTLSLQLTELHEDTVVDTEPCSELTQKKGIYHAAFTDVTLTPKTFWAIARLGTTPVFEGFVKVYPAGGVYIVQQNLPAELGGPHAVNVTVTSGGNPVENATVTLRANQSNKARNTTDANGERTLYVEDGDYTLITICDGYITNEQAVTVAGDDLPVAVSLTISLPGASSDPTKVACYSDALDNDFAGVGNVTHSRQMVGEPGGSGFTFEDDAKEITSVAGGRIDWGALPCGARFKFVRGDSNRSVTVLIPSPGDDSYQDPFPITNFRG